MQEKYKTDEELVIKAQSGEASSMEEIMRRYKNTVRSHARKFFLADGETDDLVQEGMIGLYHAVLSFHPSSGKSFKNFAFLCVTRHIYDALRVAGRHKIETEDLDPDSFPLFTPSPEGLLIKGEEQSEFRAKLLKALSDFEYRVVTLYLEGESYAFISSATGKDIKSIDNALSRAKKKLQRAYKNR